MTPTRSAKLEINCSNCSLRDLCLPVGFDAAELDRLDNLVSTRRQVARGEATEVAELVLWLSSNRASFCTGAYFPVDGGYLAH